MRQTGLIVYFALLLSATGILASPVLDSALRRNLTDNTIDVLSNKTAACRNDTSTPCSPIPDHVIRLVHNVTANVTKALFGGGATGGGNWTCGFTTGTNATLAGNDSNSEAGNSSIPRCAALLPGNVSSANRSTSSCKNATGCFNASTVSINNGTRVTKRNATAQHNATEERMLSDMEAPTINETVDGNSSVCPPIVSREDWGGKPPISVEKMKTPVPFVVIHHTYTPGACNTSDDCEAKMRSMQNYHMSKGWLNIGYNFLVGGDNRIYKGRGWDVVGAHSPTYNFKSIGICFIGDYRTELPTQEMMELAWSLIRCGVARGSISETYKLVGHRQVRDTECPGDRLYQEIQTWPHWAAHRDIIPRT